MPVILRMKEEVERTPPVDTALRQILGLSFEIQWILNEPDLLNSFQSRIDSLHQAFLFLVVTAPPRIARTKIEAYLDWCLHQSPFEEQTSPLSIDNYQQQLIQFTNPLVNAIIDFWDIAWLTPEDKRLEAIEILNKAEQYYLMTIERPHLATLTTIPGDDNHLLIIDNKPIDPFTMETRDELKKIQSLQSTNDDSSRPDWYTCLSEIEQALLRHALSKCDLSNPDRIIFIPSRLRTIPSLANASEETWRLIHQKTGAMTDLGTCLRSAHIASRDSISFTPEIQSLHTERNLSRLQQYFGDRIGLLQTLISPIWVLDNITRDYFLEQQRIGAIEKLKQQQEQDLLSSNHPFNIARAITSTPENSPECLAILKVARDAISQAKNPVVLEALTDDYEKTLNSGLLTAYILDWNGRELFLSSLEQLIIMYCDGVSYGSCVSGKDRKALSLIHTLAMKLYQHQYNQWPKYTDTGQARDQFTRIVAHLYLSFHHHYFSGQNAPGSNGIKTPDGYFPNDICQAIKKQSRNPSILSQDDRLASNNEVKDIIGSSRYQITPQQASRALAAIQLGHDNRELFITLIYTITQETDFWVSKTKAAKADLFTLGGALSRLGFFASQLTGIDLSSTPTGIYEINRFLTKAATNIDFPSSHSLSAESSDANRFRDPADKPWDDDRGSRDVDTVNQDELLPRTIHNMPSINLLVRICQIVNDRLGQQAANRAPITQQFYECIQKTMASSHPSETFMKELTTLYQIQTEACNRRAGGPSSEDTPARTLLDAPA